MKHPKTTDWADHVRSLVGDDEQATMQSHLDGGCGPCRATLTALSRVADIATSDVVTSPPDGVLRSVEAFFATQHPAAHGLWTELTLQPAFDSAHEPALAGVHSHEDQSRHLLFQSDGYTLELSLDFPRSAVDAVLRGQILANHGEPRSHAPVFLVGDGTVIGRTISEEQGNFEMSGRLDPPCELWVFPDDENRIRLSLHRES